LVAGASPALKDSGRGLRAEQWARFCGRFICAEVIEKFARHRVPDRTSANGRWGSEPELAVRMISGKVDLSKKFKQHFFLAYFELLFGQGSG